MRGHYLGWPFDPFLLEYTVNQILVLHNPIQHYAWGSYSAIPELLGRLPNADLPQAEMWMGAHVKAPSTVEIADQRIALNELIEQHAKSILGESVAAKFNNRLPFLFKVLAAARPLSVQAHPDLSQARTGFRKENRKGIPLDAPQRNYRDDNHKPECICALTPFWALNGFRTVSTIRSILKELNLLSLAPLRTIFKHLQRGQELKQLFQGIMTLGAVHQKQIANDIAAEIDGLSPEDPVVRWMITLADQYPGDIGILSPVLLNLVCLQPGQAMYLPAGELHAYLEGVGIELMANSDNVLRGGLTPKHVDVGELLAVLNFQARTIKILPSPSEAFGEHVYPCPVEEFILSVVSIEESRPYQSTGPHSAEIWLCTRGAGDMVDRSQNQTTAFQKGTSFLVPAAVERYSVMGKATLYKATVPLQEA